MVYPIRRWAMSCDGMAFLQRRSESKRSPGMTLSAHTGTPEGLPLSAARPRCEVLPILSRPDQDGKCESASIASKKPESELVRGTLGEVGQRRMSVEADPVWRIVAEASVATIYRTLPRGAQPSGQRQSDLVSFAA